MISYTYTFKNTKNILFTQFIVNKTKSVTHNTPCHRINKREYYVLGWFMVNILLPKVTDFYFIYNEIDKYDMFSVLNG
ncbi:hypothetical protein Hanom_Chr00s046571g01777301 [Helianthus anomalus]